MDNLRTTTSDVSARRLIFCANPGRSGSGFLAQLLDASPDVDAGHERLPPMTGPWLRRVAHHGLDESRESRRVKVRAIELELASLPPSVAYCDTSHMFVRTFADVVFEAAQETAITVISLRRDPVLTARSYYELGLVSHQRGTWHDWMITPTARAARFRVTPGEVESPFDLIFGSLVDAHARAVDLRTERPRASWIDVELAELATPQGALRLFEQLGVRPPHDVPALTAQTTNTKPVEKTRVGRTASDRLIRQRYREFLERFHDRPEVRDFLQAHPGGIG